MAQQDLKIRIGITQGDINGVGPEIIVKTLANSDILELFTPVLFGSAEVFRNAAKIAGENDFRFEVVKNLADIADGRINLVEPKGESVSPAPGMPTAEAGKAAIGALNAASEAIEEGVLDLLVTAPINKLTVQSDNFKFPGHTEYLEDRFAVEGGRAMMILADGKLRVALTTTHVPLSSVAELIKKDVVEDSIKRFNNALKMDFGCERPKIAVLSLNPHCGDGGLLGREEIDEIIPAIEECRKQGIMALGPISADGFFGTRGYMKFDGVLAMYHDQGLAPFKALAGTNGVNFTAGLNIIRTSPDHGTAYDKAGRGIADETSMREAIYAAIDIARRRDTYLEASENPLEIRVQSQRGPKRKGQQNAAEAEEETTEE